VDAKSLAFAGFISAGYFKLDPRLAWVPVDLTLLLAVLSIGLAVYSTIRSLSQVPIQLLWICSLFAAFAICLFWTAWTPPAADKVARLFTLTFLSMILPLLLFRTPADIHRFFNALTLAGFLLALDATSILLTAPELHRLSGGNANTGAFAHAVIAAALWLTVLGVEGRMPLHLSLLSVGPFVALAFASGSRGPLLAQVCTLLVGGVLFYRKSARTVCRFGALALSVALYLYLGSLIAPDWSTDRIRSFLQGTLGGSELARLEVYALALDQLASYPLGLGWGAFKELHYLGHPHNLLLEIFLEAGMVGGVVFVALVITGVRKVHRCARQSRDEGPRALFLMILFTSIEAMVGGDVNDHRLLLALVALALACPSIWGAKLTSRTRHGH